ncbi:MAG TPA: flavin reductase family protein [Sedimenticola sp.]|nr:flavin reductase family protein [Sedimenticola sp.]
MNIDLSRMKPSEVYSTMAQAILPRPIAWVLSDNGDGHWNLAPFSYFSAVCSDPPLLMFSVGRKPDGSPKDTHANIAARREFVVHIPGWEQLEAMNASSATLPAGVSEVDKLGLELEPFPGFRVPRLKGCRLAMACELYRLQEIGAAPQTLIFGRILGLQVADDAVARDTAGRLRILPQRLDPVARLGGPHYARLGPVVKLPRPD